MEKHLTTSISSSQELKCVMVVKADGADFCEVQSDVAVIYHKDKQAARLYVFLVDRPKPRYTRYYYYQEKESITPQYILLHSKIRSPTGRSHRYSTIGHPVLVPVSADFNLDGGANATMEVLKGFVAALQRYVRDPYHSFLQDPKVYTAPFILYRDCSREDPKQRFERLNSQLHLRNIGDEVYSLDVLWGTVRGTNPYDLDAFHMAGGPDIWNPQIEEEQHQADAGEQALRRWAEAKRETLKKVRSQSEAGARMGTSARYTADAVSSSRDCGSRAKA